MQTSARQVCLRQAPAARVRNEGARCEFVRVFRTRGYWRLKWSFRYGSYQVTHVPSIPNLAL